MMALRLCVLLLKFPFQTISDTTPTLTAEKTKEFHEGKDARSAKWNKNGSQDRVLRQRGKCTVADIFDLMNDHLNTFVHGWISYRFEKHRLQIRNRTGLRLNSVLA